MDNNYEENLKRGRQLIERLEELQYYNFNYRPKWITIHKNKLKLFMAYLYYGYPSHKKIDETSSPEIVLTDKVFELYENEAKENILKLNKNLEKLIEPDCDGNIEVGVTMTHSICKNKNCDTCQNFPDKDIHIWKLLRLKSKEYEFYVIDFEHNKMYYGWNDYMEENVLPEGYMFYPNSGFYDASKNLYQTKTPASKKMTNTGVSILNWIGGSILWISSFLFPIAAPITFTAALALTGSNMYGIGRQISQLKNMYKHDIEVSGIQSCREWINLAISGIGALLTPTFAYNAYKAMFSETTQVTSGALNIIQKTSCIAQSTLNIFRIALDFINYNFEITPTNVLHLRLDIFIATGILNPSDVIEDILKVLSTGTVREPLYKTLEQYPYFLGQKIMTSAYFFKNHFAVFVEQVTASLEDKLTPINLLFAWSTIRRIFNSYQKQTAKLDISDLLWHLVDNTTETESVKDVLRGKCMVKLLECLWKVAPMWNRAFAKYCIECVLEEANKLSKNHDNRVLNVARSGVTKSLKPERLSMDNYVLWAINRTRKNPEKLIHKYQQHVSLPKHMFDDEMVVNQTDGDNLSVKGYTLVAPCSELDFDICLRFAKKINPEHSYNNHEFLQSKPDVALMTNCSDFSINIVFFGIDLINDVPKMSICFFQKKHDSYSAVDNHKGLKKLQAAH